MVCFCVRNGLSLAEKWTSVSPCLQGGKDSASPRYIFTRLAPITRAIFPEVRRCRLTL
jgi:hypothetical protein